MDRVRLPIVLPIATLAALALLASSASAQSLGDVARKEEARRAAVKATAKAKVLTNADLAADPRAGEPPPLATVAAPAPPPTTAVAAPAGAPGNASAGVVMAAAAPEAKPKEDETYWRRRAAEHRARIEKAQKGVDALAGAAHEDPREQARVAALVKKAQDELTRANDALRLLVMQADIAGVPAAWVK